MSWGLPVGAAPIPSAHGRRPNFIFILVDELRHDALGCAGHPFVRTPNIDALAATGIRFANAFCTTSFCSPSRAGFLTGLHSRRHGVLNNHMAFPRQRTFASALQEAGYGTAFIGKWHMGPDSDQPQKGFDHWVSFKGQGVFNDPVFNIDGEEVERTGYITDLLTEYAESWLRSAKGSPFCLYLSHKAVHGPFTPAARHATDYADARIDLPASVDDSLEGKPDGLKARAKATPRFRAPDRLQKHADYLRNYYRCLNAVDDSVGHLHALLEELELVDDTWVVFAGDNGHMFGEHGVDDKRWAYEESLRIPLLATGPGIVSPGSVVEEMVQNIDLAPTLLDIAEAGGTELPFDGVSLRPLLEGRSTTPRTSIFYEYFTDKSSARVPHVQAVRTADLKLIRYPDSEDSPELYDLKQDPQEVHNRVSDSAYRSDRERLEVLLQSYLKQLEEPSAEALAAFEASF